MPRFIVNRSPQLNGDHDVHQLDVGCWYMPASEHQVPLGTHEDCHGATRAAKDKGYSSANGCFHCADDCHIG